MYNIVYIYLYDKRSEKEEVSEIIPTFQASTTWRKIMAFTKICGYDVFSLTLS